MSGCNFPRTNQSGISDTGEKNVRKNFYRFMENVLCKNDVNSIYFCTILVMHIFMMEAKE